MDLLQFVCGQHAPTIQAFCGFSSETRVPEEEILVIESTESLFTAILGSPGGGLGRRRNGRRARRTVCGARFWDVGGEGVKNFG